MADFATEYDYIIVGAGSAGCVVAEQLTRDRDVTVCILEAGKSDNHPNIRTPMLLKEVVSGGPFNWSYETEPQARLNNRRMFWPRGKTLGGSSSINAMHYMRGAKENFDEWGEIAGDRSWSWADALDRFRRQENNNRFDGALHGTDGPLHVQSIPKLNPLTKLFLQAGSELQYPENDDFNGEKQYGFGPYQVTMNGPRRWSAADAFLRPAMERGNLTVITEALGHKVRLESGKATGVVAAIKGEITELTARKEVILSGGAINSPQLLQLSGIGDPDWLKAAGVTPQIDLPGVGRNLMDHLDVAAVATVNTTEAIGMSLQRFPKNMYDVLRWMIRGDGDFTINPVQGGAFISSSVAGDIPDLQLVFIPGYSINHGKDTKMGHGMTLHVCHLYPESRGEIRIRSNDPAEYPAIDPNYLASDFDLTALTDGYEKVIEILRAPAFRDEFVEWVYPEKSGSRADLVEDIRQRAETLYHPTSTCIMAEGELGVVDPQCRVRGVSGLRVVDASAMPRLVGGNTNAPTMMLADKAGEMIRESA
ncbi:GMC family oxidoreductase N-terminal domain-containing protein [Hyphobacterium sp. HN65]|uniref:GMC family oxidoreductase N-terminal domain-containing protein n=1 Tax=Hyphobacterium lacteum TaxID=3116575 RepID=A0ABU7LNU4_9PROT|nr:GMC family oxidoreductase N-terminal domain-containing protein [Hyphobacterium sp. HN65]MEE2525593.1 GMC family oxidoreductase N-terminal domain-containing protein [Hyphobacterium sp. HN65]